VSLAFTSPPGHGKDTDDMVSSILKIMRATLVLVISTVAVYYEDLFVTMMPSNTNIYFSIHPAYLGCITATLK
jgi:hypothetical protein